MLSVGMTSLYKIMPQLETRRVGRIRLISVRSIERLAA